MDGLIASAQKSQLDKILFELCTSFNAMLNIVVIAVEFSIFLT